jgi:hypothetical protein
MVHSLKFTFVANGNNLSSVGIALGETICFGSFEFTTDSFCNLSLSPEGNDLGTIFVGMVHDGSSALHTILEDSSNDRNSTSGGGRSSDTPAPRACNVVTPIVPIPDTPPPKDTPSLLTIPTVPLQTIAL